MGIYNIPDQQYRDMSGLSQSMAKRLLKSGLAYLEPPPATSDAFRVGSLIDVMVLTPDLVYEQFVIPPDYANCTGNVTADGKPSTSNRTGYVKQKMSEFAKENQGKTFITMDEWTFCASVAEQVKRKKFFQNFTNDTSGITQAAMDGLWSGVPIKGLADGISDSLLFDLKTTRDSSIREFRRAFFRYGYGFQLRWYIELAWQNGYDFPLDQCYIIAAGKQSPIDVTVFRIPVEWLDKARDDIDVCIERYKRYKEIAFNIGQDEGADWIWLNHDQTEVDYGG